MSDTISSVNILGVEIDALNIPSLHAQIEQIVENNAHALAIHVNVYGLNLAYRQPWLRNFYNSAELCVCDGVGPMLGARILGQSLPQRITYMDWIWPLSEFLSERNYSLFMLGGVPGAADKAAQRLQASYPHLNIVGTHHGYFEKTPGSVENQAVIEKINQVRPNVLMVGFGMPRQEKWLLENWSTIQANVGLGPGALYDYLSGQVNRAPRWMTDNGLEWLGRFFEEPKRLWRRYFLGNPLFLFRVLKQRFGSVPPS